MPEINPVMMIPFLIVTVILFLLLSIGKKTYQAYVEALDKDTPLRDFLPVGFQLMAMIGYKYAGNQDRKLRRQLAELYDYDYVEFYLRVTWAQAATYVVVGLWMTALFFGITGEMTLLALGLGLTGALAVLAFSQINEQVEKRHLRVAIDLPNLTNQILILSGAGMTIRGAMMKIAREMPSEGPLYQALDKAVTQMENGATDEVALDTLVTSCNMPAVRRLVSVLLQNMQRGGTEVLYALREIGQELWEGRKAAARQIAEETTTKLLFPMVLMLLAVILLVAAPAVMSMNF